MYNNNRRIVLDILWIILGLILIGLSIAEVLDASLYSGMGGALTAVGAVNLARAMRYRKDAGYREKIDTEAGDERNQYIRMKSWAFAGYMAILLEAAGSVAAAVMGKTQIQLTLYFCLCLLLVLYWASYMIFSRKY